MTTPSHPNDPDATIFGSHPGGEGQLLGVGERSDAPARPTIRDVFDLDLGFIASVVRRVLGARRTADVPDAVSLSLIAIHRGLGTFDPARGSLRVWEYRIVDRTTRRFARLGRSLASRMVQWDDVELEGVAVPTEELMSTNELRRLWDELSAKMSEEQREVLELHVLCGLTGAEIAALKGWNENTTRSLVTLAKQELAALHRERQAKQSRAGARVLSLPFAVWADHVQETAQRVPDSMRARLLERLEAGPDAGLERLRGRVVRLASRGGGSVGGGLLGAFVFVLALLVVLVVVVLALLRRAPPPSPTGAAGGASASSSATALVATAGALPAAPLAAPPPAPATSSSAAAPAPAASNSLAVGRAPRPSSEQRRALVSAFRRAVETGKLEGAQGACAKLNEYAHHFPDDVDDRAVMAAQAPACERK